MIDIHSHILPCVDDGSDGINTSRNLLMQYVSQGIGRAVCTPHQNKTLRRADALKSAFNKLCENVADLPVRLFLGAEILYYTGMARDIASGELLTLGGSKYVLVEFPVAVSGVDLQDAVYELNLSGYVPIVAHVERYFNLGKDDYFSIRDEGALFQVNADSFSYNHVLKKLKYLLKNQLVDFIASDCHDDKRRNADFGCAKKFISKKFPGQYAKFFSDNQ